MKYKTVKAWVDIPTYPVGLKVGAFKLYADLTDNETKLELEADLTQSNYNAEIIQKLEPILKHEFIGHQVRWSNYDIQYFSTRGDGKTTRIEHEAKGTLLLEYDELGRLSKTTNQDTGEVRTITYNSQNMPIRVTRS